MKRLALLILISCVAPSGAAHDLWLEPSTFRPAKGEKVSIRFMVGDDFQGEPVPRNDPRIERFVIREAGGERPVIGAHGDDPAGNVGDVNGRAIVAYRNRPMRHGNMTPAKFEAYLREEGLEHVIAARERKAAQRTPGREIYSRSAKLYLSGEGNTARFDETFGFRFELTPQTDPQAAGPLRIRVTFEGNPLRDILVTAIHRQSGQSLTGRSDEQGLVTLQSVRRGVWLVKAVHMFEAPEGSGADWESVWATLTFERR